VNLHSWPDLLPLRDLLRENWAHLGLELDWDSPYDFLDMLDDIEWWSSKEGGFRRPGEWPGYHPVNDELWMVRYDTCIELEPA